MHRRTFLEAAAAAGILAALPARAATRAPRDAGWRTFETVARLEILRADGRVTAWMPLPLAEPTDWFRALETRTGGNPASMRTVTDGASGARLAVATFRPGEAKPVFEVTSRFRTRDRQVDFTPGSGTRAQGDPARWLRPSALSPGDGRVAELSRAITAGARRDVDKARAVYDWVVEHTERDPTTPGCGSGDVRALLERDTPRGKCADLNGLFVALVRAAGVPAREVYGLRVAPSGRGFQSLGKAGDVTRAQHCRAEFFAAGIGWVPVDPADVRKVVLEERPGLTLADPDVARARAMLWGGWEGNWLAYNHARDIALPGSSGAPLPFLMYPQAENAAGRIDPLDPDAFTYRITAREIAA